MSDKDTNQVFDKEVTNLLSTIKVKLAESGKDSPTVVVDNSRIRPKSARLPIHRYVAQIWHLRHFIVLHARYKAVADNDEMFLGKLWTVLEPIFRIAMYGIMFGLILNTSRGIENFIGFLTIGITYFGFISRGPNSGAGLVQRTQNLIGTFNFPRATMVVGESVRGFFMALIPALLATIGALLFQLDRPLSWTILWAIPLLVLIQIFAAGLMFISARITAFLPECPENDAVYYASLVLYFRRIFLCRALCKRPRDSGRYGCQPCLPVPECSTRFDYVRNYT